MPGHEHSCRGSVQEGGVKQEHSCRTNSILAEARPFLPKQEHSCRSRSILAEARAFLPKQEHSCRSKSIPAEAGAFLPKQEHSCRSKSILAEARAEHPCRSKMNRTSAGHEPEDLDQGALTVTWIQMGNYHTRTS